MNIYIISTTFTSIDLIKCLDKKIKIKGLIGLKSEERKKQNISGFSNLEQIAKKRSLEYIELSNYSLKSDIDRKKIFNIDIDYLIIAGWQRLIPQWFIDHVNYSVIGCHGSSQGITKGRGRSPQNWSIILGEKSFYLSIFEVDSGVDSGRVIDTRKFNYSKYDNIKSSYYKTTIIYAEMLNDFFVNLKSKRKNFKKQDLKKASYLPKRLPEDGVMDWNQKSEHLKNFVYALAHPYPGATTILNKDIFIKIWDCIPFEIEMNKKYKCGEIVKIFSYGDLLVKTLDSYLLVTNYKILKKNFTLRENMVFKSIKFNLQIKNIISRHKKKYPDQKISKKILNQSK